MIGSNTFYTCTVSHRVYASSGSRHYLRIIILKNKKVHKISISLDFKLVSDYENLMKMIA